MSWNLFITNITWVVNPIIGVNQNIQLLYRKYGTNTSFIPLGVAVVSSDGSILSPAPLSINNLPDSWNSVEVKAINQCSGEEFFKVINQSGNCAKPQNISVNRISDTSVNIFWEGSTDSYDWLLVDASNVVLQQGNTTQKNATINGLVASSNYVIKIRGRCGANSFSPWVVKSFNTNAQQGSVSLDCIIQQGGDLIVGHPAQILFFAQISNIIQTGIVNVTVHDDKSGSVNGYRIYGASAYNVNAADTTIPCQIQYDGSGPGGVTQITFIVSGANGTQTCTSNFSITTG